MKKVLITKLSSLGDLVHALPALSDAMNAIPEIEFDWVVDQNFQEIPLWHPSVRKIFLTNHRTWRKKIFSKKTKEEFSLLYKQLHNQKYDLIIDGQGNIKSGLLSLIPKGKRAGWDRTSTPEWGSHFFYQKQCKASKNLHAIERLRLLFASALEYPAPTTPAHYQIDPSKLKSPSLNLPSSYLIFVPIASYGSKLWPDYHWIELIKKASQEGLFILLPWGNLKEKERAEKLAISKNVIVLPRLSLNEIGYLISKSKAMVSVDTGLSHIAAALNVPTVTLYGPTDPKLTGTIGKNQYWITPPAPCAETCKKACSVNKEPTCLQKIPPETVWNQLTKLL